MNRKNKISFLKYFEPINIILFLFIIVTALFIYNINQTNEKIQQKILELTTIVIGNNK